MHNKEKERTLRSTWQQILKANFTYAGHRTHQTNASMGTVDLGVHLYSADRSAWIWQVVGSDSTWLELDYKDLWYEKTYRFTGVGHDLIRHKVSNLSLLGLNHSIRMHYDERLGTWSPFTTQNKPRIKTIKRLERNYTSACCHTKHRPIVPHAVEETISPAWPCSHSCEGNIHDNPSPLTSVPSNPVHESTLLPEVDITLKRVTSN